MTRGDAAEPEDLRATFAEHFDGAPAGPLPDDLSDTLRRLWEEGRAAWPGLAVGAQRFARHLAERIAASDDLGRTLADVHATDLYLACACTYRLPGAIERFEAAYAGTIGAFLSKVDRSPAFADEVRQVLREKLFVADADGAPPRIAGYSGRGQLSSWVGVAAQRTGLSLVRGEKSHDKSDDTKLVDALPAGADPELDYLRTRYRTEFREAFQAAVAALSQRERMILRLHLVTGLSHEKIGALYQVNQSTASRWIAKARESIARDVERHLRARLNVSKSEFHSLAHLVGSQLDLSLARWLGDERA